MSNLAHCLLCGMSETREIHDRCRDSESVRVLRCETCGLVFLSDFSAVSEEFYEKNGMYEFAAPDRAAILREEKTDTERRVAFLEPLLRGKRYVDFGCGAGGVLEGVRRECAEAAGVELNQALRGAVKAETGVRVEPDLDRLPGAFDVVSLFHVLEHLRDPVAALAAIRMRMAPGGTVVVEVPHAQDALLSRYNLAAFRDFTYWTCHFFLFTESTLRETLKRAGFADIELRFPQRYPLANHLRWLAEGKSGGHAAEPWRSFSSPELDAAYAARLAELGATDTLLALARS